MKKTINVVFDYGDEVILKTDPDIRRITTGYVVRKSGVVYELAAGTEVSYHNGVEIEKTKTSNVVAGFLNKKNKVG